MHSVDHYFQDISSKHRKKVTIHPNGDFKNGKVLWVEPEWDFHDLLCAASVRLGTASVSRAFNGDGEEIDDCMMIEDDDILFMSQGDLFVSPLVPQDGRYHSDPPTMVGGYKVGKFLGRGGFGEVRIGEHHLTKEKVALKLMSKSDIMSMGAAERTTTEIQCLTALRHPHIITLLQHLETPTDIVLVLEVMRGGDLHHYLLGFDEGRVSEDEARGLMHQILSGVSYAHTQHICHRDLKLENILLKNAPPQEIFLKIADFGLSDFYRPGAMCRTNCGSLSYLAPEVFLNVPAPGPPLDVWSLGIILFALLCGRLPFEGGDLRGAKRHREILKCTYKIDEGLSPEAKDLLRRMLRVHPNERATVPEIFGHCWIRQVHPADKRYPPGLSKADAFLKSKDSFEDCPCTVVEALDTEAQSKNSVPRAIEGGAESLMIQVSVVESPASDVCRGESEESEHDTNTGMELGHDDGFGIQSPVFKLQPLRRVAQANEQVTLQRPQTVHAGGACMLWNDSSMRPLRLPNMDDQDAAVEKRRASSTPLMANTVKRSTTNLASPPPLRKKPPTLHAAGSTTLQRSTPLSKSPSRSHLLPRAGIQH